jgi:hypothetical protein
MQVRLDMRLSLTVAAAECAVTYAKPATLPTCFRKAPPVNNYWKSTANMRN